MNFLIIRACMQKEKRKYSRRSTVSSLRNLCEAVMFMHIAGIVEVIFSIGC